MMKVNSMTFYAAKWFSINYYISRNPDAGITLSTLIISGKEA